jgi:hypothetical protein
MPRLIEATAAQAGKRSSHVADDIYNFPEAQLRPSCRRSGSQVKLQDELQPSNEVVVDLPRAPGRGLGEISRPMVGHKTTRHRALAAFKSLRAET